ncbi:MAG: ATP-dependent DNA ligase [Methanoculleaceae archaeon]
MLFIEFARLCEQLEGLSGRLEMIDLLSQALRDLSEEELPLFVRFVMGKVFPDWSQKKLGIGPNHLYEAAAYVIGTKKEKVVEAVNRIGDPGGALEELLKRKEQTTFFREDLTLSDVYRDCEEIASAEGRKSQRRKILIIRRILANARPLEGRYFARLVLGELRIGIGEGNVRDALSKAFGVESQLLEHAHQALNDLGEVAVLARRGSAALQKVEIKLFRPVRMMLAQQGSIDEMVAEHGLVFAEFKYDGSRIQLHKKGDTSRIFSRRLEDVTVGLPDIAERLAGAITGDVIIDGEVIAIRNGRPLPFQYVIRRFRRKHDVETAREEIELVPRIFDILYLNGETLIDRPLHERREILEKVVDGRYLARQFRSGNAAELEEFYHRALDDGHEGIMIKVPASRYTPGVRGKAWVKIKPEVDTLDLVVIGAEWGEGRRAHLFGSFLVACLHQGDFLPVGKVATGFSDEQLQEVYSQLKDTVISTSGKSVNLEPTLVFEVGFSEIQTSPNYRSGYALRFPRLVRIRYDKGIDEADTLESVEIRYRSQTGTQG